MNGRYEGSLTAGSQVLLPARVSRRTHEEIHNTSTHLAIDECICSSNSLSSTSTNEVSLMFDKPGRNPALPEGTNNADCATCGNFRKVPGQYCSEYRIEPPFNCMQHTDPRKPIQVVVQRNPVQRRDS